MAGAVFQKMCALDRRRRHRMPDSPAPISEVSTLFFARHTRILFQHFALVTSACPKSSGSFCANLAGIVSSIKRAKLCAPTVFQHVRHLCRRKGPICLRWQKQRKYSVGLKTMAQGPSSNRY